MDLFPSLVLTEHVVIAGLWVVLCNIHELFMNIYFFHFSIRYIL